MVGPSTTPVIAGLVAGISFIVLLSQASFETSIKHYTSGLIDSINPRFGIDDTNRKMAVDIMLRNSTVTESFKDRHVYISGIAVMPNGCSFGACARIDLLQRDDAGNFIRQQAQVMIDYPNQKVIRFRYTDGW